MKGLYDLIASHEDWLLRRVHRYAREGNYSKYTSTPEEAWRASVADLSERLLVALQTNEQAPELGPDDDSTRDRMASGGKLEAQRHRPRGITLEMFSLMKYYKQSYIDLVHEAGFERDYEERCRLFVERFFDQVELGSCAERADSSESKLITELQTTNQMLTEEKNKYLTIFASLPYPAILLDKNNQIENMNHAASDLLLGSGNPGVSFSHEGQPERILPWLADELTAFTASSEPERSFEKNIETPKGFRHLQVKLTRMLDGSGKFRGTVGTLNDLTDRTLTEDALAKSHDFRLKLFDDFPNPIWRADPDGKCNYFNRAWLDFSGRSLEHEMADDWAQRLHPEDLNRFLNTYQEAFKDRQPFEIEYRLRHHDGEYRWIIDFARPFNNLQGNFAGYIGACYDIHDRKQTEEKLMYLSTHDPLTGLYNRNYFEEEMARLERGRQFPVSLVIADVDGLKITNDFQGHAAGDKLLQQTALLLKSVFRAEDVVARIGGDEFAVLLPRADARVVKEALTRVRNCIASHNTAQNAPPLSLSLGAATAEEGKMLAGAMLRADERMYKDKLGQKQG